MAVCRADAIGPLFLVIIWFKTNLNETVIMEFSKENKNSSVSSMPLIDMYILIYCLQLLFLKVCSTFRADAFGWNVVLQIACLYDILNNFTGPVCTRCI